MDDKLLIPGTVSFKVHLAVKKIDDKIYCAIVAPGAMVATTFVIDEVTANKIQNVLCFSEKVK